MKERLFIVFRLIVGVALLLTVLPERAMLAAAQGTKPPHATQLAPDVQKSPENKPYRDADGLWVMPSGGRLLQVPDSTAPQTVGGPDDYGYMWDDSIEMYWVDVENGYDTHIHDASDYAGPILIGFSFKYYEKAYGTLYISPYGFVSFDERYTATPQSQIPNPARPNNVIAPFWVPVDVVNGYVRYYSGGTAPNRWFVVEWNRVESDSNGTPDEYTFELILFEDGSIIFQYKWMTINGDYYCPSSGIEDSSGLDGLPITAFCQPVAPNHAVFIARPGPSARAKIHPVYQGDFTSPGETTTFQIPITNAGDLGGDIYDLSISSLWPVSIYAADGTTPLTDTNNNGTVDTGLLSQGHSTMITAKITTPDLAVAGDANSAAVTFRSSIDPTKSKTAILQTAVPAPFAQIYYDTLGGKTNLFLVQPVGQVAKNAVPPWFASHDMAIAEMSNGFAYFWSSDYINESASVSEIKYTLLDYYGRPVRDTTALTDHSWATVDTYDYAPAVAVSPDGHIGVVWYRDIEVWDGASASFEINYNVFFAVLDASGNVVYGPVNLTNNTTRGKQDTPNVPRFYEPRIAATSDNHFVLAWHQNMYTMDDYVDNVYYTIRDSNGAQIKGITNFTSDGVGRSEWHGRPNLAQLPGGNVLLTWNCYTNATDDVCYAVLDSTGNMVKDITHVNATGIIYGVDATALSNGNSVIAWQEWNGQYRIAYTVLDTAYNVLVASPLILTNPAAFLGDGYVSVAADGAGHAILTWTDPNVFYRRNLYYALVDGNNGGLLTSPMIFRSTENSGPPMSPDIETSYAGYGNTSYSWMAPSSADGVVEFHIPFFGGAPGGTAEVGVHYTNRGGTATDVVLTATLATSLTYVSDTSGITPVISGNDVVWNLPDMTFLENHDFTFDVHVPTDAVLGTHYPITITLSANGTDANPADNTANADVMAAYQVFFPLIK